MFPVGFFCYSLIQKVLKYESVFNIINNNTIVFNSVIF